MPVAVPVPFNVPVPLSNPSLKVTNGGYNLAVPRSLLKEQFLPLKVSPHFKGCNHDTAKDDSTESVPIRRDINYIYNILEKIKTKFVLKYLVFFKSFQY